MTLANSSNSQTVVSESNNTQGMTREAVAARRIAALAQQSTKSTSDQTTTTISNEALQSLLVCSIYVVIAIWKYNISTDYILS